MKVAVVATHPVQYYAPWYRALAKQINLEVLYGHKPTKAEQGIGFDAEFEWDGSILEGYPHRFLVNAARRPNLSSFNGVSNPDLQKVLGDGQFDCVILHGWATRCYVQALMGARRRGIPVLVRGDSQLPTRRPLATRALKAIAFPFFLRQFAGFLIVGKRSTEYLTHFGVKPNAMFFSPHCVDNDFFVGAAEARGGMRKDIRVRWGLPTDGPVFLFAGKFLPRKRPLDFLMALETARAQGSTTAGLMVGDGPLRPSLESFVRRKNLPVTFTGFLNQQDIPDAYAASDGLVLPSDGSETWGLVVNEAMASGLPALVSDVVGCAPDLIVSGVTGNTFPVGSVARLAEFMTDWSGNPHKMKLLGEQARRHVAGYSVAEAVGGTLEAIQAIAR